MKPRLALFALLSAACAYGAYTYEFPMPTAQYISSWYANSTYWSANTSGSAFSEIWVPTVSSGANSNDYEVNATLALVPGGGTYIAYLRATSNGLSSPGGCAGSYVSVEIAVPSSYQSGPAAGQLTVNQCVSGTVTQLGSASIAVLNGTTFRTVIWTTGANSTIWVYLNNQRVWALALNEPLTTGQPGFGGYGTASATYAVGGFGGFASLLIGHRDTVAPSAPSATGLRSSILPYQVSLAWQGAADDTNGIGVEGYRVSRNGTPMGYRTGPELGDSTVQPGTSYTYSVAGQDFHGNNGPATAWTITTPPATAVDPRRIGLNTNGRYWGGGGEQIDTLSGNLNFSLPLVTAQGRTGWNVSTGLSYNSQNWRQDAGTNWQLGSDVGYGYGWKIQLGSITPYYLGWPNGVDHYAFTDSSGAEYRLDQNSGGVWSSKQGVYVWFDANLNTLHFRDGTFWIMGTVTGGAEADAGTLYPTILEDVSGNQVTITYLAAPSLPGTVINTSARISTIQGVQSGQLQFVYVTHNTDAIPHLTYVYSATNSFTVGYAFGATLGPPFGTDSSYSGATTAHLTSITPSATASPYQFTYDSGGASELTQVTFPWGGHLRWTYATANYAGSRSLREVYTRYLAADSAGATEWTYPFTHSDSGSTISVVHADTTLADASGVGAKTWTFNTGSSTWSPAGAWQLGLATQFSQTTGAGGTELTRDTYTWAQQSSSGIPYIAAKVSVSNPGVSGSRSAQTTQTIDPNGNVMQVNIYPYTANPTTPLKTYDNTYLTGSSYLSDYVRNRLYQSKVTPAGVSQVTLVTNAYDTSGSTLACGALHPCPTSQFDATSPVPLAYRGFLASSVNPAKTTTNVYYGYGALYTSTGTDGSSLTNSVSSTTNYAAPDTITTQSYSNSVAYDAWTSVTQTTGLNGEQMYLTYDTNGRPATATSPYGTYGTPTVVYAYSAAGVMPVWQSKTGPDGYTKTTLDGLGRPIKVQRGPNSSTIQSETDMVYAPCACSPLAKLQKTSQPYASGTPAWTTYTYDGIGRTLSVQQPDGASTTTYSYLGNQTTVTDPRGSISGECWSGRSGVVESICICRRRSGQLPRSKRPDGDSELWICGMVQGRLLGR